jgi:hypothetical protein
MYISNLGISFVCGDRRRRAQTKTPSKTANRNGEPKRRTETANGPKKRRTERRTGTATETARPNGDRSARDGDR